jgi:hypothetical protein
VGASYDLRERECEDTGASKTCAGVGIDKLYWSAEKLELTVAGRAVSTVVNRYGHFPNDGTYLYGSNGKTEKSGKVSLLLMDYGSKFQVISGHVSGLKCKYAPDSTKK